jgi:WD40 repeat protein
VWRADGQGEPVVLRGHEKDVESAAFSPDGKWVVTASGDSAARVWRADGQGEPVVLRGHEKDVESAAFSPDGAQVVTASKDGTARVWTVGVASLQGLLHTSINACLSQAQRERFLWETADDARSAHEQCERAYGRTPLERLQP